MGELVVAASQDKAHANLGFGEAEGDNFGRRGAVIAYVASRVTTPLLRWDLCQGLLGFLDEVVRNLCSAEHRWKANSRLFGD